jgi:hypothetical protein
VHKRKASHLHCTRLQLTPFTSCKWLQML